MDPGKIFNVLLGNLLNRLHFTLRAPVTLETTHGFLVIVGDKQVCRIGTNDIIGSAPVIFVMTDIWMNDNRIVQLPEPFYPHEAANKRYVDNRIV